MRIVDNLKLGIITLFGVFLFTASVHGQPIQDRVLDNVTIEDEEEVVIIQVGFSFPVRYVSHFPPDSGDELRIQLTPIAVSVSDFDALFKREAIRPRPHEKLELIEVIYEGDIEGGPYLTLLFEEKTSYRVKQGKDYRSLVIITHETEATESSGESN